MEAQFARFLAGEIDFQEHRRERVRAFLGARLDGAAADAWFARYVRHYEAAWTLFPDAGARPGGRGAPLPPGGALPTPPRRSSGASWPPWGWPGTSRTCWGADLLGCAKPDPRGVPGRLRQARAAPRRGRLTWGDQLETARGRGARPRGCTRVCAGTAREGRAGPPCRTAYGASGPADELPGLLRPVIDFGAPSTFG
ncbi:HAD family hydrolase [Streptomyces thioluteus]|uniref:HAD family hydrolase n=1 Tax=Streptomyces thioluteus TaxID=66431 RepID=A0ABP6JJ59_STRTU